jgi:hypothetical protein
MRTIRLLVFSCALAALPAAARAQQMGPPTPLGIEIAKVPVGSWADYEVAMGTQPAAKSRMALVGKTADSASIELVATANGNHTVGQAVVEPGKGSAAPVTKKLLMQVGSNDPMEMPPELAASKRFKRMDPKSLVGSETITVPAGSFKTKHYREKTGDGDDVDYWISDQAPPLGLVKMRAEIAKALAKAGAPPGAMVGPMKMELAARGKDAKPEITKPAKPFDQAKFMQEIQAGAGGGPPAGAPQPKKK